jgi:hypothetical protein
MDVRRHRWGPNARFDLMHRDTTANRVAEVGGGPGDVILRARPHGVSDSSVVLLALVGPSTLAAAFGGSTRGRIRREPMTSELGKADAWVSACGVQMESERGRL